MPRVTFGLLMLGAAILLSHVLPLGTSESVGFAQQSHPATDDALGIVVNRSNPVENLSLAELRKIFMGEQTHWSNGRRITVVMRRPFDQWVCSPINILRSSASDKFSTGFERFTTIPSASSVAGWLCGANPTDSLVPTGSTWDSKMAAPNINKPKVTRGIVAHL